MSCDLSVVMVPPGSRRGDVRVVGVLSIRDVGFSGQYVESEKCLDINVETYPTDNPVISVKIGNTQVVPIFNWLTLEAEIWTVQVPRRQVGRVHIPAAALLPIGTSRQGPAKWQWVIQPEDVEVVERARAAQPAGPLYFHVEIKGIAKLTGPAGELGGLEALRGQAPQLVIEHSQWERLLGGLDYALPPSHVALVGLSALDHPSWAAATSLLEQARNHHRSGEDYEALQSCLSAFEAVVTAPYNADSWKRLLTALPDQKANGIAELLSGLATYCNRIGHHRSRAERDASGDLPQMPLDHWEADLVLGAAQFLLAYVRRLRLAGVLAEVPPMSAQASTPAPEKAAVGPA
jgi:hypothetical protein